MVDKYIKEILFEHGKVYVPGIGLIFKDFSEEGGRDPFVLNQPKYSLKVDQDYINDDDTWLIYATARGSHITIEEAEDIIKGRVAEIRSLVESGKEATIEGVGTIINDGGKLIFNYQFASNSAEEGDNAFGIPDQIHLPTEENNSSDVESVHSDGTQEYIAVESISERQMDSEVHANSVEENSYEENHFEEEEESGSRKGMIAAIIIVLLITIGTLYYFFNNSDQVEEEDIASTERVESTVESIEDDKVTAPVTAQDNDSGSELDPTASANVLATSNKPLTVKEKGKRYYIIAGAFTINENAQKLKRRLSTNGIKAKVLEPKDQNPLYRVSLGDFEELDQALANTETLKKTHGNSLWILKY